MIGKRQRKKVQFGPIILEGIMQRSFGQWVHLSYPWICLGSRSGCLPQLLIGLAQLLIGLESPNRDSKSPNKDSYVLNVMIDS